MWETRNTHMAHAFGKIQISSVTKSIVGFQYVLFSHFLSFPIVCEEMFCQCQDLVE